MSHVQDITIINYFFSKNFMTKDQYIFRHIFYIYFVIEFQNRGNEHDMDFYGLKMCLCM